MTDAQRARRDAEKAAREALNGTLVDKAGELGVALAAQAEAADAVTAGRAKATALLDAAHADGAALISAAQAKAAQAHATYAAAWHASKDAGWTPAQLRSMGYTKPPAALLNAAGAAATESTAAADHVATVA